MNLKNMKKGVDTDIIVCYFYYDRHSMTDVTTTDVPSSVILR